MVDSPFARRFESTSNTRGTRAWRSMPPYRCASAPDSHRCSPLAFERSVPACDGVQSRPRNRPGQRPGPRL